MDVEHLSAALPSPSTLHELQLVVALLALLTFWILLRAGRHLRHRRFGRAVTRGFGGIVLGGLTALILLLGLNILTYARFTAETPVAEIRFTSIGPQHYAVTLTPAKGHGRQVQLDGDDWQLDARVIKWKGIGTLLGLPPLYRLERLSGRYENLQQAQHQTPSVVGLSSDPGIALTEIDHVAPWLPLVDARYGSATFLPMANGAVYRVSLSNTGLLARPANAAARSAVSRWQ